MLGDPIWQVTLHSSEVGLCEELYALLILFNLCYRMEMMHQYSVLVTTNLRTESRWTVTSE